MFWYIIGGMASIAVIGLILYIYIRDRRYERLKASQAMRRQCLSELEEERDEAYAKRDRFRQAIREAEEANRKKRGGV
jgi:hypothetical protein